MNTTPQRAGDVLRELVAKWRADTSACCDEFHCGRDECADDLEAALSASPPVAAPGDGWRGLWDSQWVNIVNHADCYRDYDKEEAINIAVKLTEQRLRENNAAAPTAPPVAVLTDTFVQTVPDQCDRIVWRGNYYALPLPAAPASREASHG